MELPEYAKIGGIGLAFYLLEVVSLIAIKPIVRRVLGKGKKKLKPDETSLQVVTRLVGFVHNTLQTPLAFMVLANPAFQKNGIYEVDNISSWVTLISAGFFLYDVVMCTLRYKLEGPFYLLHACCCFWVYAYAYHVGYLHYYGAAFLMWELSTPFVHLRWFLYIMGLDHTQLYLINALLMMLSFFLCRIVWGYYISTVFLVNLYQEYLFPRPGGLPHYMCPWYAVTCIALNILNSFWMYKMIQKAVEVFFKGKNLGELSSTKDL